MSFEIGDKVSYLNTVGTGTVMEVSQRGMLVEDENGFTDWYAPSELVKRAYFDVGEVRAKDQIRKQILTADADRPNKKVVDLHFDALVDFPKNFTSHEKLEIQLREVRKAIDTCKRAGIKKLILIHGVGEGRLKEEVHTILERLDRLQFYDASLAEYGRGATEVEFT